MSVVILKPEAPLTLKMVSNLSVVASLTLVLVTIGLVSGQLPSKDVIEQSCPDLPPIADPKDVDLNWVSTYKYPERQVSIIDFNSLCFFVQQFPQPENFKYMPLAAKHAYRLYAEIFLGRPAKNEAEIDEMDYHSDFKDGIAQNEGFGKEFRQICAPITQDPAKFPMNAYSFICITLGGNVNASAIGTF